MKPVSVEQADVIQALTERITALTLENAQLTAAIVSLQKDSEESEQS